MIELGERGGRIKSIKTTNIEGIYTIRYKVPKLDRAGNMVGYKEIRSAKTVYDPKKISDEQMLKMGQQAAAKEYINNLLTPDKKQYNSTINGIDFRIYFNRKTG